MGFETLLASVLAVGGAAYNSHQSKKANEAAVRASKEAALRNVSVGVSQATPSTTTTDTGEAMDISEQNTKRRKLRVGDTINKGGLLSSSLTGNRSLLGG